MSALQAIQYYTSIALISCTVASLHKWVSTVLGVPLKCHTILEYCLYQDDHVP